MLFLVSPEQWEGRIYRVCLYLQIYFVCIIHFNLLWTEGYKMCLSLFDGPSSRKIYITVNANCTRFCLQLVELNSVYCLYLHKHVFFLVKDECLTKLILKRSVAILVKRLNCLTISERQIKGVF